MVSPRSEALSRTLDLLSELVGTSLRQEIDEALRAARIRLVVSAADLLLGPTQAAVYVLCSLLTRSGMSVEADLAAVPRIVELPGLVGSEFGDALRAALPRMFPGASLQPAIGKPDIVVAFGAAAPQIGGEANIALDVKGSRASIRRLPQGPCEWRPADTLAALAGVGLAASEIHKDVLRRVGPERLEVLQPQEPSFIVPVAIAGPTDIGFLEAVSAGAIVQNFVLTLAAENNICGDLRLFDRDIMSLSNANRCPFTLIDLVGSRKVDVVDQLVPKRLHIHPVPDHLNEETAAIIRPGSTIVVGADDIKVRHLAQSLEPDRLTIGATSHFLALITEHPAGAPCAGCAHPHLGEDVGVIPTCSIVSYWAGYLLAVRVVAHAVGLDYPAARTVTNFWALRPGNQLDHSLSYHPRCPVRAHIVRLGRAG